MRDGCGGWGKPSCQGAAALFSGPGKLAPPPRDPPQSCLPLTSALLFQGGSECPGNYSSLPRRPEPGHHGNGWDATSTEEGLLTLLPSALRGAEASLPCPVWAVGVGAEGAKLLPQIPPRPG